jgi:hypothetical protein
MKTHHFWPILALPLLVTGALAAPVGTGFTYQGELKVSAVPANGAFDFEFALFNVATAGSTITTVLSDDAPVTNGLFTVELDFTDVPFAAAEQYWLEVHVREGASTGAYQALLPRQKITPTPYALNARTVQAGGVNQGALSVGAVGNAQIGDLAVTGAKIADATITAAKLAFAPGDITDVVAGNGLSGGAASGAATLAVNTSMVQTRVTGICPVGSYLRGIHADGTALCSDLVGSTILTTISDSLSEIGQESAIAIGSDGMPVISYRNSTPGALAVAKCPDAACVGLPTITTVDGPTSPRYTDIAIGNDGLPVISYWDFGTSSLKVAHCVNPDCSGVATITTVDDPANSVGRYTSIAIGSDGLPVISYQDETAAALKVAHCVNVACTGASTITTVDDPVGESVGYYTAIAIGSDGLPVISYGDLAGDAALRVAKCTNLDCSGTATITTVDDPPINQVGDYTSIAIGSDGLPVISYRDSTAAALKVAKCSNAACTGTATITTVDDPANLVGEYTSIAIGSDGLPVISYRDATAFSLKVARCANAACTGVATITTVDDPANQVGEFTSIAIGNDGKPVISYYDRTATRLKVAKCGTQSCQ